MKRLSLVCTILAALFTGCSFRQTGYRYADWLIESQINKHLDLEGEQKRQARALIKQTLNEVSHEILPKISTQIADLSRRGADGAFSTEDAQWFMDQYTSLIAHFFEIIDDPLATILSNLTTKQLDHLERKLADNRKDDETRLKSSDIEYEKKELKRFVSRFGSLYGDLSNDQEKKIAKIMGMNKFNGEQKLKIRAEMNATFVAFLRNKPKEQEIQKKILAWSLDRSTMIQSPDLKKFYTEQQDSWKSKLVAIDGLITHEQRQHMTTELTKLSEDLAEMSKRRF